MCIFYNIRKNLAKSFHTLVQCEHWWLDRRAQSLRQKNKTPVSKFLKDRGVGKGKLLSRSFLSPCKSIKKHNPAFSLAQEAQRKSLAKRKRRFMGAAQTRKFFEKNLTKNFHTLV